MNGKRYGLWVVVDSTKTGKCNPRIKVRCDCGKEKDVLYYTLTSGRSKSCGCQNGVVQSLLHKKHGMFGSPVYICWGNIIQRCNNQKNNSYKRYGARGIKVCERWLDFQSFYADMGNVPKGMSIDRIDNDGDYTPANCKWSTRSEQAINQRTRSDNKTGIKGVFYNKNRNKYMSYIFVNGKQKKLYYGPDFDAACAARKDAETKYLI